MKQKFEPVSKWTAAIGYFNRGLKVELPDDEIQNLEQALTHAQEYLNEIVASDNKDYVYSEGEGEPYVVQIYHNEKIVWDYMSE